MLKQRKIYKVLLMLLWIGIGIGTGVLLVAAAMHQKTKKCAGIEVEIDGVNGIAYVSKPQIIALLSGGNPNAFVGRPILAIDLEKAEQKLEQNLWIRNAELYFDNKDLLQVKVTEREPVARIFTQSGLSFYVDDTGECLPINNEQVARVPVFTSFPAEMNALRKADSIKLLQVRDMGAYMLRNKLWMAQIEQVDLVGDAFELVPKLGNHMIYFGDATQMEQKFKRLELFYKRIMRNTGWNYYGRIDLSYNKLLIATRRDRESFFQSFVLPSRDSIVISNQIDSTMLRYDSAYMQTSTTAAAVAQNKAVQKADTAGKRSEKAGSSNTNAVKPKAVMSKNQNQ